MNNIEVDFQKVESVVTNDVVHIKYNDQDYTINESKIRRTWIRSRPSVRRR